MLKQRGKIIGPISPVKSIAKVENLDFLRHGPVFAPCRNAIYPGLKRTSVVC